MKMIIIAMLLLTTLPAKAQWIGGAQPVQNEQAGSWAAYSAQDQTTGSQRKGGQLDCTERRRQAAHDLMAAERDYEKQSMQNLLRAFAQSDGLAATKYALAATIRPQVEHEERALALRYRVDCN